MTYYYRSPDGSAIPSGITVLPDGQGFFVQSSGAVPGPSTRVVGPSLGSPVAPVVFSPYQTQPLYRQPVMAPISLVPYPYCMRPVLVAPSGGVPYQSFGVASSSTPVAQLVPQPYIGRSIAVASQPGMPYLVSSAPPSANGSYTIPSYNFSPPGIYQYPTISGPYHSSPPLSTPYQTALNPTRLPLQNGPLVAIGQSSTAVNPNVPGASYQLTP